MHFGRWAAAITVLGCVLLRPTASKSCFQRSIPLVMNPVSSTEWWANSSLNDIRRVGGDLVTGACQSDMGYPAQYQPSLCNWTSPAGASRVFTGNDSCGGQVRVDIHGWPSIFHSDEVLTWGIPLYYNYAVELLGADMSPWAQAILDKILPCVKSAEPAPTAVQPYGCVDLYHWPSIFYINKVPTRDRARCCAYAVKLFGFDVSPSARAAPNTSLLCLESEESAMEAVELYDRFTERTTDFEEPKEPQCSWRRNPHPDASTVLTVACSVYLGDTIFVPNSAINVEPPVLTPPPQILTNPQHEARSTAPKGVAMSSKVTLVGDSFRHRASFRSAPAASPPPGRQLPHQTKLPSPTPVSRASQMSSTTRVTTPSPPGPTSPLPTNTRAPPPPASLDETSKPAAIATSQRDMPSTVPTEIPPNDDDGDDGGGDDPPWWLLSLVVPLILVVLDRAHIQFRPARLRSWRRGAGADAASLEGGRGAAMAVQSLSPSIRNTMRRHLRIISEAGRTGDGVENFPGIWGLIVYVFLWLFEWFSVATRRRDGVTDQPLE